jgi:uncharacterized protein (TIGR00375 family)
MKIITDLHVHSKYSRATARDLDLENLYEAAQIKGIQLVGTGDFSHPAWFAEIESKLDPAEPGLLRLKEDAAKALDARVPPACRGTVRFVLATEISNIYKKAGRTRKNHNLVFVPDLETARNLNRRLERIGNIHSDGRPILGLDARDLLELVLETSPDAFLVPAHIWTPWFSMLGSKSGFDSIGECFGDLAAHVFAAETGLSSDPAMNWRVTSLDAITLVSNSDAHSPGNLGREANLFDTELSFYAVRDALKSGDPQQFLGTIEFYPEEGKYHLDGHRNCGVSFEPRQTSAHQGICPQCGKPLTIGVLNRVEELADRPEGIRPKKAHSYHNLIPLIGILSEILQAGPKTQKVCQAYRTAIERLGPEITILDQLDLQQIERAGIPLLGEAVRRMREKKIDIKPGFDGEYGKIKIFSSQERADIQGQRALFGSPSDPQPFPSTQSTNKQAGTIQAPVLFALRGIGSSDTENSITAAASRLNPEQQQAVMHVGARLLIVAGPGTGKTHTLTCRIAHLITAKQVLPQSILAVTFTNKAAEEMRTRLRTILGETIPLPFIATFHGLCFSLLQELNPNEVITLIDEDQQAELIAEAVAMATQSGIVVSLAPQRLQEQIMRAKQSLVSPDDSAQTDLNTPADQCLSAVYRAYQLLLESQRQVDFEDLIFKVVHRLESDPAFLQGCRDRFRHVFVDEYQDLNHGQYRIIRALAPPDASGGSLCVIGDPDQSIYGFRGSDAAYFHKFMKEYPDASVVTLTCNYRSTNTILSASFQVINTDGVERSRMYSIIDGVKTIAILELANEHAEAESIAHVIEGLVGGTGFHAIDTGRVKEAYPSQGLSYADFAVLTRTSDQLRVIAEGFGTYGIPFQIVSRQRLFKEKGVAEVLALLKVLSGGGTYADFEKVAAIIAPNLGRRVIATFKEWCLKNRLCLKDGLSSAARFPIPGLSRNQQLALTEFASRLSTIDRETSSLTAEERLLHFTSDPGIAAFFAEEKSREALNRLVSMALNLEANTVGLINRCALYTDTDVYHPRAEKAALMTMHAAKGLEFPVVFIAGCEDELIPYRRPAESGGTDIKEERRLFYVAMTRAKDRLYLTLAKRRSRFGRATNREISPFVKDIEQRLLTRETLGANHRKRKPDQLKLF